MEMLGKILVIIISMIIISCDYYNAGMDYQDNIALEQVVSKRLVRTVLIFTESSDQLSRATDRVPGLPASPGYVQ